MKAATWAAVKPGRPVESLQRLTQAWELAESLRKVKIGEIHRRNAQGEHDNQAGHYKPHKGNDELRPDQAMDADGKGKHQVALIPQEIFIKPVYHYHKGHDACGENAHAKACYDHTQQKLENIAVHHL